MVATAAAEERMHMHTCKSSSPTLLRLSSNILGGNEHGEDIHNIKVMSDIDKKRCIHIHNDIKHSLNERVLN